MKIIGHKKNIALLDKQISKNRLAHAYIFLGPENVGKFTVAVDLAEKLTGKNSQKINPDLIIIRPEEEGNNEPKIKTGKATTKKREIKIDQIREVQKQLSFFSENGKYKVAIIDEAERMNKQAQNALLKTLEEPNDFSVIILVTKNDKKLLPTIISRCQKIKFGPLTAEEIEEWSEEENIFKEKEKEKKEIVFWSMGRPGVVLKLVNEIDELEKRKKIRQKIENLMKQNLAEKFSLAEEMSKNKEELRQELGLWIIFLRQVLLQTSNSESARKKLLKIIEETEKSLEIMRDTNANARLALESLMLEF
jgi:DNA polymerase-3 subunit delta'